MGEGAGAAWVSFIVNPLRPCVAISRCKLCVCVRGGGATVYEVELYSDLQFKNEFS
jgi:hypothetical protein